MVTVAGKRSPMKKKSYTNSEVERKTSSPRKSSQKDKVKTSITVRLKTGNKEKEKDVATGKLWGMIICLSSCSPCLQTWPRCLPSWGTPSTPPSPAPGWGW